MLFFLIIIANYAFFILIYLFINLFIRLWKMMQHCKLFLKVTYEEH